MRSTHSFLIDFILRRWKEDKTKAFIYARISIDGDRAEISLKEIIDVSDWDPKRQMVQGTGIQVKELNKYIDDVRFKIKLKYRMLLDKEALITAETVKLAYLGVHTIQKGHTLLELLDYYKKIWEHKLKNGGFKNYKTTVDYVKRFIKQYATSGDMYLSQISMELAVDFEFFIRANPVRPNDPCDGNGLAKHIQRFKRILNWAVELKWMEVNPVDKFSSTMKKPKRKKVTMEELVLLEKHPFIDPTLNYVKDLFLYACFSGLAYIDCMALSLSHFEWDLDKTIWCKIYRTKSDELCPVPLLPSAARILEKYKPYADEQGRVFPRISNQEVNTSLKVIQEICGIATPLTFHIGRHTFAKTIALKNGIPLETVQMMMGHTKISTTQIYADVDEEKIIEDMSGLEDKLDKKREIIIAMNKMKEAASKDHNPLFNKNPFGFPPSH